MRRFAVLFLFSFFVQALGTPPDYLPVCYGIEVGSKDIISVLRDLEKVMAQVKTIRTDFVQEKYLALFNQKIELKGKVFIQKPGLLSWRVFAPLRYSMVVKANTIRQWDEDTNQVQQVSLEKNPSVRAAMEQMQNWFSGAYESMSGEYIISRASEKPLVLVFVPKENAAAGNFIAEVRVSFQLDERYLKELRIKEKSLDTTVITFFNTVLNEPIPAAAWEVKANVQ